MQKKLIYCFCSFPLCPILHVPRHWVLQATASDSPSQPGWLNNLGLGLHNRYARTGNLTDLEEAITAYQQSLQAAPPDSPDRPGWLNNLGLGLHNRYVHTGDLTDLEAAITAWETSWSVRSLHFAALPVVYKLGQQGQEGGNSGNLAPPIWNVLRRAVPVPTLISAPPSSWPKATSPVCSPNWSGVVPCRCQAGSPPRSLNGNSNSW